MHPAFAEFIRDAEGTIDDPEAIAARLQPLLAQDGWLARRHQAPGADRYRQHLLHVSSCRRLSVVALVWRPGQRHADPRPRVVVRRRRLPRARA